MMGGWDSHPGSFQVYGSTVSLNVFYYAEKLFQIDVFRNHANSAGQQADAGQLRIADGILRPKREQ